MRSTVSKLASGLLLTLPLFACSREEVSHASQSAKDAASATGDKLVELKDKFVAATQKEMDELSVKYKELEKKASAAAGEAKEGLQSTLDDIRAKKEELTREFEESKRAHDGSTFEAAKAKVKDGLADLRRRIDDALHKD